MPCHWHIMCSPSNSKLSNFESLQVQDKKMIVKKHPKHSGHESFVHAFRHAAFVHDLHLRGSPSSTSLSLAHLNEDAIILHQCDHPPSRNPGTESPVSSQQDGLQARQNHVVYGMASDDARTCAHSLAYSIPKSMVHRYT